MFKRRTFTLVASVLCSAVLLGACGSTQTASTGGAAGAVASPVATAASQAVPAATTAAPAAAAGAGAVSFKTDVQPLFASRCTSCHGSRGGLTLGSYAAVLKGGTDGPAVKPGDADGSLLVQKVKGTQKIGARMPLGSQLSDAEIQKISDWVAQGAKDN